MAQTFKLDAFLPYRLSVASNRASRVIAGAYEERFGLAIPEWRLIAVLAEDGQTTQQAVVGRTVMDKVTVSRAAKELLKRRLISRTPHGQDGRSHYICLTAEGRALYEAVVPVAQELETRLFEGLTAAECEQLDELTRRIERAAEALKNGA